MKTQFFISKNIKNERGVALVWFAILILVFLGIAALAVDIGYLMVGRTELQRTADAAALAGARRLGVIYTELPPDIQITYNATTDDQTLIKDAAVYVALENRAAGSSVVINPDNDIQIGRWNPNGSPRFTPGLLHPDAVQVVARRDDSTSPISTFFYPAFAWLLSLFQGGVVDPAAGQVPVSAIATAALSGPSTAGEGELKVPIGLSVNNFPNNCTDLIELNPTPDSCAGWHNFFDNHNANFIGDKALSFIAGHPEGQAWLEQYFDLNHAPVGTETPQVTAGQDQFDFTGGTVSSLFTGSTINWTGEYRNQTDGTVDGNPRIPAPFIALFDFFRMRDSDSDDRIWTATIPVYADSAECDNPSGLTTIVGFADIEIIMPCPPPGSNECPSSTVRVNVDCDFHVIEGRSGGGQYGNLRGSIPALVQ
jgi:hypothetical protein